MTRTEQLKKEYDELPSVVSALSLKGKIQLLQIYEGQLNLLNEMRNTVSASIRNEVMDECLKKGAKLQ